MEVELTRDCEEARKHPVIVDALAVLEPSIINGGVDFAVLQEREFMPFWQYMMITEVLEEQDTFKYIYVGTDVVSSFGYDFTNDYWVDDPTSPLKQFQKKNRFDVIKNREMIFACGKSLSTRDLWLDWKIVYVPLTKGGKDNYCLNVHYHTKR